MQRIGVALLLFSLAMPALAGPLLYRLDDADSTVWLLGSVHALRDSDYPLDERIEAAYRDAERVVLEVSPGELDPGHLARVALPLARYANGSHLADVMTETEYARVRRHFGSFGVKLAQFREFEPWFVALQAFALNLAKSGYAGSEGVDRHFADRAIADGKATAGFETAAEQFSAFDGLPLETQKAFLLDSVDDNDAFQRHLDEIVAAWRRGDAAALAAVLEREFEGEPALRKALLVDRNRRWVPQIEKLLASGDDGLVVVGALHLVGSGGLVDLLEERGYDVRRVE